MARTANRKAAAMGAVSVTQDRTSHKPSPNCRTEYDAPLIRPAPSPTIRSNFLLTHHSCYDPHDVD